MIPKTYELVTVACLSQALVQLDKKPVRIVLIDQDFDDVNVGWVLAERVRQQTPETKVVVFVSGPPQKYFAGEQFKGKFDWVMSFPISKEQLIDELDRRWPTGMGH